MPSTQRDRAATSGAATRVAIYARVSTSQQSPEMQLADLRRYATSRGLEVAEAYIDQGISGSKERRPQLDRLMAAARKKEFGAVLVWRFDRFARSVRHLVQALDEFRHLDISFLSFQENIDTSSPMGNAMFQIIAAMAELERNLIRERVIAGLANARRKGKRLGRPRRAVNLSLGRRLLLEGHSYGQAAKRLGISKSTLKRRLDEARDEQDHP